MGTDEVGEVRTSDARERRVRNSEPGQYGSRGALVRALVLGLEDSWG